MSRTTFTFKDHFSGHAEDYAKYRPGYPPALFEYLASIVPRRHRAWDCATGTGQVAVGLARFFDEVVATDASARQIEETTYHPRVRYGVAPAERSGLEAGSIDLVAVGQALHWLDLERFYGEARHVLVPGGVIAAWSYDRLKVDARVDAVIDGFYREVVGPYWPAERALVEDGYRSLSFPFAEIAPPRFSMEERWDLAHLLGYLRTWSAVRRFISANGRDPVDSILPELAAAWGLAKAVRRICWPLGIRVGRL